MEAAGERHIPPTTPADLIVGFALGAVINAATPYVSVFHYRRLARSPTVSLLSVLDRSAWTPRLVHALPLFWPKIATVR